MKYETVFGTDLPVSALVLGGDSFGATIPQSLSEQMMDEYMARGGNQIDTAALYGIGHGGEHTCEASIGMWMKKRSNRHHVFLAGKGGHPNLDTMHVSRLSEAELRSDLEASLTALNTDYIDLYWLHRDDPHLPAGEVLEYLNQFQKEGKIRFFGASNWTGARIDQANRYASAHSISGFSASQIMWSAAEILPGGVTDDTLVYMNPTEAQYYKKKLLPVYAYSSQANGYFSKFAVGEEGRTAFLER